MTEGPSPLDAHTERLAESLHEGAIRQATRRRRRRRTVTLVAPFALAGTLGLAVWPSAQIDVIERANAALMPKTEVVHIRVTAARSNRRDDTCAQSKTNDAAIDVWLETTGTAPRWRVRQPELPCATLSTGFGHRAKGPTESAYDGEALIESSPAGGWVERLTDPPAAARAVPDVAQLAGISGDAPSADPVRFLRQLLAAGHLRVERRGIVRGRDAYWLTGIDVQRARVRVAIDARTYAPITIIRAIPESDFLRKNPQLQKVEDSEQRFDFERYESAKPEDLHPVLPRASADTIDMDWAEAMAAMRARMRAESRAGHLRALRMQRERAARP